ncbi:FecR family protein, partial [Chitinophaga hostae]|uniref:FecR family protein n=1 Tax=Chitinophaga hostae TaxID=2831022 RepID=UPI003F6A4F16
LQELDLLMQLPEAEEMSADIEKLPRETLVDLMSTLDVEDALVRVHAREAIIRTKKRASVQKRWMVAASILLIAGTAAFFLRQSYNAPHVVQGTTEKGSARLKMADGRLLTLNDTGSQRVDAFVSNTNRVISLDSSAASAAGWTTLVVPSRLDYRIDLIDGSRVWLNSETSLRFSGKSRREVHLEYGEAYFEVAHNANMPFTVHTPNGLVKVLGTSFNVNAYSQQKIVTSLITGRVIVEAGIDKEVLAPGNEAVVSAGQAIMIQPFDQEAVLGWRSGIHFFKDATIEDVAVMIRRWFGTELIIDNSDVRSKELRGTLKRHEPLQAFVDRINAVGIVTFYWDDEGRLHCK